MVLSDGGFGDDFASDLMTTSVGYRFTAVTNLNVVTVWYRKTMRAAKRNLLELSANSLDAGIPDSQEPVPLPCTDRNLASSLRVVVFSSHLAASACFFRLLACAEAFLVTSTRVTKIKILARLSGECEK